MAKEIERKFLVDIHKWSTITLSKTIHITQAYLAASNVNTVRIRISDQNAFITIKGKAVGISRNEYEYPIPLDEAKEMLQLVINKPIQKKRHIVYHENKKWEVDEFLDDNAGLFVAEIELADEAETFVKPEWTTREVTYDTKYRNTYISQMPFCNWKE